MWIGNDIEEVSRIRRLLESKPHILERLFHADELLLAQGSNHSAQTLTGIWCSKEAVVKAAAHLVELTINDVLIGKNGFGQPTAKILNEKFDNYRYRISISISHTKQFAFASALVFRKTNNQI